MRIHRIRLRNYRGIDHVEVRLAERGVTIVEGPNEVGKSSLAEAIGLVFDARDSSAHSKIRDLQPVHRDVGTEVTIEVTTGPYHFELTKVWNRGRRTELDIHAPHRQQLRGRAAHDRVVEMLDETLDRPLWDALRVLQSPSSAVPFGEIVSLGHVLDASAGAELAGDREGGLWADICAARDRYWTPTGQPRVERSHLVAGLEAAKSRRAEVEAELAELAHLVIEVESLAAELARLDETIPSLHDKVASLAAQLEVIGSEQRELHLLQADESVARQGLDQATGEVDRRRAAVDAIERLAVEMTQVAEATERRRPELDAAVRRERELADEVTSVRGRLAAAEQAAAIGHADLTYRRQQIEIEQLTERRDRVQAACGILAELEAELVDHVVDERFVEELVAADLDVARAEAALRATGAVLAVRAATDASIGVDGSPVVLAAGQTHEVVVGDRVAVQVGEIELVVEAGFEARAAADAAERARASFTKLCVEGGVSSVAEARKLAERRAAAVRARDDAQRQRRDNLRDLTFEQIVAKIDGHAAHLATYLHERPSVVPLPGDYEAAKVAAARADRDLAAVRAELARVEADADDVVRAGRAAQIEVETGRLAVLHAREAHAVALEALVRDRGVCADDELEARRETSRRSFEDAVAARTSAARRLAERRPDDVEALLANATQAAERAADRRIALMDRRRDAQAMLAAKGELGLQEQLDDAHSRAERARRELARWDARAGAARRLHQAFDQARARARQRYVAPFRERIEQLGRLVFGSDVEIALDDDLRPSARTLGGTTLRIDQLSGGAREQLDLIARLACAGIVSADGGAPVVLDDTLGWSDPVRRDAMGATIALAGRDCQIIVLTCSPERFASVGNATVVRLADAIRDARPSRPDVSEGQSLEPGDGQLDVTLDLDALGADRVVQVSALVDQRDQLTDRSP